jgi:hypothetical protein
MKNPDPLASENLQLPDSLIPAVRVPGSIADCLAKKKAARKGKEFVKLPVVWIERLVGLSSKTVTVAHHILLLHFKNHGQPFPLPNGQLSAKGVDREMKSWALAELERVGLIEVERRPKKSPIVRPLHTI